jgi:hypothetical protein
MTVLRVLLTAAPAADRAEAWALFDAAGRCVRKGHDRPAARPKAERVEFVLAAAQVRVARITLPPLPSSRVADAARFALEDQLAGPDGTHHIAVSAQARDGGIRVAVASRSLLASVAGSNHGAARVLAEPDLALPAANWIWCARDSGAAGFVCRPDGSTFPVEAPPPDGGLPSELTLALARPGAADRRLMHTCRCACCRVVTSRWQGNRHRLPAGQSLALGSGAPAAFADAIDLLQGPRSPGSVAHGMARLVPRSRLPPPRSSSMSLPPSANGRRCDMKHGAPSANGSPLPSKPASRRTLRHPRWRLGPLLRAGMRHCSTRRAFRRPMMRCPSSLMRHRHWPPCPSVP